jgi:hypothetical protein
LFVEEFDTARPSVRRFRPPDGPGLYGYLSRLEAVRYEPYGVQSRHECERLATARAVDPAF